LEQEELVNEETTETMTENTEEMTEEPTEQTEELPTEEETLTSSTTEEELTTSTTTIIPATLDVEALNAFTHYGIGLMLLIVLLIAFKLAYNFFRIFF